jgi:hypothetical protein
MTTDNSYRKGRIDTLVEMFSKRFDGIEKKLDDNIKWQRTVDERLAAGNIKFEKLDEEVQDLRQRDKITGALSLILATIAGIIGVKK